MSWDHFLYPSRASSLLSQHLKAGTLALFLGAGVSRSIGLPGWDEFVNCLRRSVGLPPVTDTESAEKLQLAADEVQAECRSQEEYFGW